MAEPLPPLPPPWVACPSGLPPVPQVPKTLLGRPARRIEAHLQAYGRRGPTSPSRSQGRCIWHLPWSRVGNWPRSALSGTSASLLLGCWAREGGALGVMSNRHPAFTVHPRAEIWGCRVSGSAGWAQGRGSWCPLAWGTRAQGSGAGKDTLLAPSISAGPLCPPAGDKRQARPVCPESVFWLCLTWSHKAAWNSPGQGVHFQCVQFSHMVGVHELQNGHRGGDVVRMEAALPMNSQS